MKTSAAVACVLLLGTSVCFGSVPGAAARAHQEAVLVDNWVKACSENAPELGTELQTAATEWRTRNTEQIAKGESVVRALYEAKQLSFENESQEGIRRHAEGLSQLRDLTGKCKSQSRWYRSN